MSQASTEIIRISGHAGTVPGAGLNREFRVCQAGGHDHVHRVQSVRSGVPGMERIHVQRNHV